MSASRDRVRNLRNSSMFSKICVGTMAGTAMELTTQTGFGATSSRPVPRSVPSFPIDYKGWFHKFRNYLEAVIGDGYARPNDARFDH